jgi:hypothetical protein
MRLGEIAINSWPKGGSIPTPLTPQPSSNSFTTNVKTMMRYSTFNHLDLKIFDMKPLIEIINTDNEPNIIDQILTNNPMPQPINYCDIIALGFTAEDVHDSLFEKMHGYPYTIFTKML